MKLAIGFTIAALAIGFAGGHSWDQRSRDIDRLINFEAGRDEGLYAKVEGLCGSSYAMEWERLKNQAVFRPFARFVGKALAKDRAGDTQ